MRLAKPCPKCGRYPAFEKCVNCVGLYVICRYKPCELYGRVFRLDEWNARPIEDEKKAVPAPKKDAADLIRCLDRAKLALEVLEKLLKEERR